MSRNGDNYSKVTIFTVGEKVSSLYTPSSCAYSLATRQSLYLSKEPSDLYLTLKIHLQRIAFFPRGNVDNTQVLFFIYASYFTFMAAFDSSFPFESSNVLGSNTWHKINRSESKIYLLIASHNLLPQSCSLSF